MCDICVINKVIKYLHRLTKSFKTKTKKEGNFKMKKILTTITGVVAALMLFMQGAGVANVAYAAGYSAASVKQSQFEAGIYGNNNNGDEIAIALYNTGSKNIGFITDGKVSLYDTYTMTPTTLDGATNAQRYDIGGVTFTYFEIGKDMYILTDDGDIYTVGELTAYEAEQIRK